MHCNKLKRVIININITSPCSSQKDITIPQGILGIPLKRKDLKNNMAFTTQGDRPIRSPEVSNRHMSFSWPLRWHVIWHLSLHNVQCGTPIHVGIWFLDEGNGHMAPPFSHPRTHLFFKKWSGTNIWNLTLSPIYTTYNDGDDDDDILRLLGRRWRLEIAPPMTLGSGGFKSNNIGDLELVWWSVVDMIYF